MLFGKKKEQTFLEDFGAELTEMILEAFERDLSDFPFAVSANEWTNDHLAEILAVLRGLLAEKKITPRHYFSIARKDGRRGAAYALLLFIQAEWSNFDAPKDKGWKLLATLVYAHDPVIAVGDDILRQFEDMFERSH